MPPKDIKETLIFIINVGLTSKSVKHNSVVDKAKAIVKCLIEKKIFLRPKDEVGVILMGSAVTKNELKIDHIQELNNVQVPEWDLVETIINLKGTSCISNWVEAVYVALNYVKRECLDRTTRILVLLSDFKEDLDIINQFEASEIAKELETEEIQLLAIGEEPIEEKSTDSLNSSESLVMDVCKQINGQYLTYDNAVSDVRFYKKLPIKPTAWSCNLELIDIQLPISTYIIVTDDQKFPPWKTVAEKNLETTDIKLEQPVKIERERELLDRHRVTYNEEDTIFGYKYGGVFIPFSNEDEKSMIYESGEKCYKIHSFVDRDTIGIEYWCSGSTRIVVPTSSFKLFYSLVQAMDKRGLVAVVRKVSRKNAAPRMVALFPRIKVPDEPWGLVEIELPFAEDRRVMESRPLKSVMKELSKEQEQAVDELLDSWTLTCSEDEDDELFLPGCVPNPKIQNTWNMLSYRAINPNKPLPPVDDYLKKLLEPPEAIKEKSRLCARKISELFQLVEESTEEPKSKIESKDNDKENLGLDLEATQTEENKQDISKDNETLKKPDPMDTSMDVDLDELAANI